MFRARVLAPLSIAATALFWAVPASAWVEVHVVGDEVRVRFERGAPAIVEHKIHVKVAGGPLRSFDLRGVDGDAAPEEDAYAVTEKEALAKSLAAAVPLTVELMPPGTKPTEDGSPAPNVLRIRFPDKGLKRGAYVFQVRYKTRLLERGLVKMEGSVARVRWQGPIWEDGFESRVTFDFPGAPVPPRAGAAASPADPTGDDNASLVLSTLRRTADRDELEVLRPYASKGEPLLWNVVADSRAWGPEAAPRTSATAPLVPIAGARGDLGRWGTIWLAGGVFGFLMSVVAVIVKGRQVAMHAASAGVSARPIVPISVWLRAPLAAMALAGGVWLHVQKHAWTLGAACVLAFVLLAAHRSPLWPKTRGLRKPGRWLPVAAEDAFRPAGPAPSGAWLDVSTRAGKALFALLLAGVAAGAFFLWPVSRHLTSALVMDAVALLALFGTGRIAELPPKPKDRVAPFLAKVAERLRKRFGDRVRLVGRERVPDGEAEPDELRLGVIVRGAPAGLRHIEVGAVLLPGAGGALLLPSMLVRYSALSAAETALAPALLAGKVVSGKKPEERAVVLSPRLPTVKWTADLAARVVDMLLAGEPAQGKQGRDETPQSKRDRARQKAA